MARFHKEKLSGSTLIYIMTASYQQGANAEGFLRYTILQKTGISLRYHWCNVRTLSELQTVGLARLPISIREKCSTYSRPMFFICLLCFLEFLIIYGDYLD